MHDLWKNYQAIKRVFLEIIQIRKCYIIQGEQFSSG